MKKIELIKNVKTPAYVVDQELLIKNLEILKYVEDKSGAKVLLAQKAFSMYKLYPIIEKYLSGTTASSLNEAMLGKKYMKGETHIFAPAYKEDEIDGILSVCDHIIFNSTSQLEKYIGKTKEIDKNIECGIRINPEYSEVETEIYNPCAINSRLGITLSKFEEYKNKENIDGLHFHTMCEQGADTLERTLKIVEERFGKYLYDVKWLNMGGGHHITKNGYDVKKLIKLVKHIRKKYNVEVYLEPGEAVALNTGYLVTTVLDIMENNMEIAILDTSAACHMPDIIEMPYRANIVGANKPNVLKYTYRLAGPTCLAGDIIGDYSFNQKLKIGDKLIFEDMAHYTMVKNNTFNGINLPDIVLMDKDTKVIKSFGFKDFEDRL